MTQANWKVYLSQARAELDRNKLVDWVTQAEESITARLLAIAESNGNGHDGPEISELHAAGEELRKIQVERLGYPDWKQTVEKERLNPKIPSQNL